MKKNKNIFIAGHNGMVGSAILKKLKLETNSKIIVRDKKDLNLMSQSDVGSFFLKNKVDEVYLAAAKVGGILANFEMPADFIMNNLSIQLNAIKECKKNDVDKLLFLGSSCIYPKYADQPIKEEQLLKGALESTNEPYAIAKITGIKMCESMNRQHGTDFRSVMPTNLYGENDNFDPNTSHVIPGLIHKFHDAKIKNKKEVVAWGTGKVKREFLHSEDLADACVFLMSISKEKYWKKIDPSCSHINIGCGHDFTIKEVAEIIKEVVGFKGKIKWDASKPDGTPRKLLCTKKISSLGWKPKINLYDGIARTYSWYKTNLEVN